MGRSDTFRVRLAEYHFNLLDQHFSLSVQTYNTMGLIFLTVDQTLLRNQVKTQTPRTSVRYTEILP